MNEMKKLAIPAVALVACVPMRGGGGTYTAEDRDQKARSLCGYPDAAFQSGYNDGYAGQQLDGEWTSLCAPAYREQTFAAYQNGFLRGANNAPVHVVHTVNGVRGGGGGGTARAAVSECTFDSDCGGDGWHCR